MQARPQNTSVGPQTCSSRLSERTHLPLTAGVNFSNKHSPQFIYTLTTPPFLRDLVACVGGPSPLSDSINPELHYQQQWARATVARHNPNTRCTTLIQYQPSWTSFIHFLHSGPMRKLDSMPSTHPCLALYTGQIYQAQGWSAATPKVWGPRSHRIYPSGRNNPRR